MQFSLLLCTFYNEYFHLMSLKFSEALSDKQNIGFLIWICLYSTKVIYINNQCTKFYREVEVTAYLLRKLDICYLDNFIRDEVQQFLLQLFLHPLKFTAGGYILNNRLSTMFFGTIISYLVVLIQISSSPSLMKPLSKSFLIKAESNPKGNIFQTHQEYGIDCDIIGYYHAPPKTCDLPN
ncbi:hypothetical protein APICC_08781 [Apis cerana cerana]|uniref:Uncharacterized protein n=1 Tax=Apis cerana cerana TaxID=94128 RepID=A0A2A3E281_APICC|nr:hypothetical protein APICC_08781 [Apis cerana cerana]